MAEEGGTGPAPEDWDTAAAAPAAAATAGSEDLAAATAAGLEEELREAMDTRDRSAIEEAIEHAEGVPGVDPFTLLGAKGVLEELDDAAEPSDTYGKFDLLRAKAEAEMALIAAAEGKDVDALKEAIAAADEAGVSAEEIEEASAKIPLIQAEVEERAEASLELSMACNDRFPSAAALGKAIARAQAAGLPEAEWAQAQKIIEDMQQKGSKDELAKEISVAMSKGDRDSLRSAIPLAEAAGVNNTLLDQADERLKELDMHVRLEEASAMLETAVEKLEPNFLREAIMEAEEAGIEEGRISAAKKLVPQADLLAAMQGEDIDALEEAVDAAKMAKLPMQVVGKGNVRLAELKQRVRAREDLIEALADQDVEMLRDAIRAAEDISVESWRIEEAKQVLSELEIALRRENATKGLSDATAGSDREKLRQAVKEAKAADCGIAIVEAGELRLATLDLQALIKGDSITELQLALGAAEGLGVDEKLMEKARTRVTELEERDEARLRLQQAMTRGNIDMLKKAMYAAGMARVENEIIEEAQKVLDRLKKEAHTKRVRQDLMNATRGCDIEELRDAIKAAQKEKLEEALIVEAQDALEVLEWKAYQDAVTQKLLEVRETDRDIEALQAAITEAISAKIDDAKILSAKELLTYWQFAAIIPKGDVQGIQNNILAAEASGVHSLMVVEALQHAVRDAEADTVSSGYLKLARKMLAMLEERVNREMASAELESVIPRESVEDLQRAILGGQLAGVDPSLISAAEKRIRWLEERARAGKELSAAMRANDIGLLQWSVVDAQKASVNKELVGRAKQMLREMESQALEIEARKVTAYEQLRDAVRCGGVNGIDSLEDAVHDVRSIGLGMRVFSPTRDAEQFAKEDDVGEEEKDEAWEAWERASEAGNLEGIRAAMKEGLRAKLEPWELGVFQKRLRQAATNDLRVAAWANAKDYNWHGEPKSLELKPKATIVDVRETRRSMRNSNRHSVKSQEVNEANAAEASVSCENCGALSSVGVKFCTECGHKLGKEPPKKKCSLM